MTPHRMAERGIEVHVLPATATVEDVYAVEPGRRLLLQRPRRPGHRRPPRRAHAGGAGARHAAVRHLLRQPDPRPRARLRHVQAEVRPPRHQPARAGPHDRQGRGHRAQPRLRRRRARSTGSPRPPYGRAEVSHVCLNDNVVEGLRLLDQPAFSVQYHPEAAAGPHDAAYLFDRFVIPDGGPACLSAPISSPSWSSAPARSSSARPPSSTTPAPRPAASSRPRACASSWSTPTRRRS